MKYNSKISDRIKNKMTGSIDTNRIVSNNKIAGNKSVLRSAKINIGKIANKQDQQEKNIKKLEGKLEVSKPEEKEKVISSPIKAFKKGAITYINYKGKQVPVSYLLTSAKTDPEAKTLVNDINRKRKENNFVGSLPDFLLKNYS